MDRPVRYQDWPPIRGMEFLGARQLYVATTGSDSAGDGSQSRPWATVNMARQVIASAGYNRAGHVIVNVAAGTYWNTSMAMSVADSGATGYRVRYRASGAPGSVVLAGGTTINPASWVNVSGSIYRTPLATPVWTMWENGVRGRAARLPKLAPGASFPSAFAPYFTSAGVTDSTTVLQYNPVDFDPSAWTLADIRLFVWSAYFGIPIAWFTDTHGVTARDTVAKQFTLDNGGLKFNAKSGASGSRYVVQGALPLLTEAGEFVCTGGFLYYWARDGSIGSQEIVVPTTKRVVSIVGASDTTPISNIDFDGIGFAYSDFNDWYRFGETSAATPAVPNDYPYWSQLSLARNGLVYMENADRITFSRCRFKNAGFAGVYMRERGQGNEVSNSIFDHIGTDGVYLEGRAPGAGDVLKNNFLTNNIYRNFGELAGNGMGIQINQSSGNIVSRGEFYNGPRNGIRITGWDDVSPTSGMYARNNAIRWIYVHDVCQDSGDCGAIGLSFFSRIGKQSVDQCLVDHITAHASMLDTAPNAVFCDNQSDGQAISNVYVTNTPGGAYRENDSTSTPVNCSWIGGFNIGLMDFPNIGTSYDNPYVGT